MSVKVVAISLKHIENYDPMGKVINVYDTYANALAHGATGLMTINQFDRLLNKKGAVISQVAPSEGVAPVGPTIDSAGNVAFVLATEVTDVYINCKAGRMGGPLHIAVSQVCDS